MRNKQNKRADGEPPRRRRLKDLNWVPKPFSLSFRAWASEGEILGIFSGGMQRSFREETNELGWKNSFSQGIGITAPKARKRDKAMSWALVL
ncbi:hypothetical protein V6N13_000761 [Hibiscus sabdariffa]